MLLCDEILDGLVYCSPLDKFIRTLLKDLLYDIIRYLSLLNNEILTNSEMRNVTVDSGQHSYFCNQ